MFASHVSDSYPRGGEIMLVYSNLVYQLIEIMYQIPLNLCQDDIFVR